MIYIDEFGKELKEGDTVKIYTDVAGTITKISKVSMLAAGQQNAGEIVIEIRRPLPPPPRNAPPGVGAFLLNGLCVVARKEPDDGKPAS